MTIDDAIGIMRNLVGKPADVQAEFMAAAADVWEEAEGMVECQCFTNHPLDNCPACAGTGYVSNGNAARAKALRLLAECGRVGAKKDMGNAGGYFSEELAREPDGGQFVPGAVPEDWYDAMRDVTNSYDTVTERLALLDAYAAADHATRERWARETRALVAGDVECPECRGKGTVRVADAAGDMDDAPCERCGGSQRYGWTPGTGRVPRTQPVEEVTQ